jgi:hypothetical protein
MPKNCWTDAKKRPSASCATKQLREVVRMTLKRAMEDAKSHCKTQIKNDLHAMQIEVDAEQETEKMHAMEAFVSQWHARRPQRRGGRATRRTHSSRA